MNDLTPTRAAGSQSAQAELGAMNWLRGELDRLFEEFAIPGRSLSFGQVEAAQAAGDLGVLAERGRRYLRLHITGDVAQGLAAIAAAVEQALARA